MKFSLSSKSVLTALVVSSLPLLGLALQTAADTNQDSGSSRATVNIEANSVQQQSTGRRVALVIGNAEYYVEVGRLSNPVNDAIDMATALEGLGFDKVILQTNSNLREMKEGLDEYYEAVRNGYAGVFYYAGHGIQSEGENFLIPIDARLSTEGDLQYEALPLGQVLSRMDEAESRINIVILDACRNNPFDRNWRSVSSRGLATVEAAAGFFIAYATEPGGVASDGTGRNGTFTSALLSLIRTPDIEVETLFKQVRASVHNSTHGEQTPWDASSLIGNFAFNSTSEFQEGIEIAPASNTTRSPVPPDEVCLASVCTGLPQ